MENNETQEHSGDCKCKCPMCCGHHDHGMCRGMHGPHFWIRVIVKILVAIFIFWCGVQFGELRGMLHGGYPNYRMMSPYGAVNQG